MTIKERLKKLFADKDEKGFTAVLDEIPDAAKTEIHVHTADAKKDDDDDDKEKDTKTMDAIVADVKKIGDSVTAIDARVKKMEDAFEKKDDEDEDDEKKKTDDENRKIEGSLEEEAPPGTSDGIAAKAKDSAYLADSFQESISLAEIISPGVQVPTFDQKADPKKTYDSLCRFRRTVLDLAFVQPELRSFIDSTTNGRDHKKFTCDAVRTLFRAVGQHKKALNAAASIRDREARTSGGGVIVGQIVTPADLNKRMAEIYSKQ